jgi:hypothetical protein
MGNWIPGDPTLVAQILRISSAYTPAPPAGFVSPMTWGDEGQVRERLEAAGIPAQNVTFERASWTFRLDGPPSELLAIFRTYYGPTMNAFEAAAKDGREDQLAAELEQLFVEQNRGGERTEIAATFLKVIATKR